MSEAPNDLSKLWQYLVAKAAAAKGISYEHAFAQLESGHTELKITFQFDKTSDATIRLGKERK